MCAATSGPACTFVDLADLNRQARDWLDSTANVRVHGTTGEVPFDRLPLEQLLPLDGKPDYDTSLISLPARDQGLLRQLRRQLLLGASRLRQEDAASQGDRRRAN